MSRSLLVVALLVVALLVAGLVPARAATASCGGLAPLELDCATDLVPATSSIAVVVSTAATFVGVIEVRLVQGDTSQSFPCIQASVVTSDCTGMFSGGFQAGQPAHMTAEVFSYEGITPSIGEWSVTATG